MGLPLAGKCTLALCFFLETIYCEWCHGIYLSYAMNSLFFGFYELQVHWHFDFHFIAAEKEIGWCIHIFRRYTLLFSGFSLIDQERNASVEFTFQLVVNSFKLTTRSFRGMDVHFCEQRTNFCEELTNN